MSLESNLILHYQMNENLASTVVRDRKNFLHGTSIRNTNLMHVAGIVGGALSFNGTLGDFVEIPDNNVLDFGMGSFSFSMWFKSASPSNITYDLIRKYDGGPPNVGFYMSYETGVVLLMYFVDSNGNEVDFSYNLTGWNDTNWHNLVFVIDRTLGRIYFYRDTILTYYGDDSENLYMDISHITGSFDTTTPLFLGQAVEESAYFLDDVMIFNIAKTQDEIILLYNNGNGVNMAQKYWQAEAGVYEIPYNTGTTQPVVGETLNVVGAATETCVVIAWTVESGSWANDNAVGKIWVNNCSTAFIANFESGDDLENSGDVLICNSTGEETDVTGHWVAGNFGTGENVSVPVAADEIIFDGRSIVVSADGLAVGETGGINFDLLHFKKSWEYGIGSAAERLHTSAQKIIIEGTGTYYIEVSGSATGQDVTIPLVIINNKEAIVYLTSNENTGSWCCEFAKIIFLAGTLYIGDTNIDTAFQYLYVTPIDNKQNNCVFYIHEDCERIKATTYKATICMLNGTGTMDSAAQLIEQYDGDFNYGSDLVASPETGLNIEILQHYGGNFNWYPDDSGNDAYIGEIYNYGGLITASGVLNNNRSKVLGKGAGYNIYNFEGATIDIANNMGNISLASGSKLWNFGGAILIDNGSQITVNYDQP